MITRLSLLKASGRLVPAERSSLRSFSSGDINKSGGTFSKREHAQEEQFFRQREREELEKFREDMKKEGGKTGKTSKKETPSSPKK